jgi:hypothetical protein
MVEEAVDPVKLFVSKVLAQRQRGEKNDYLLIVKQFRIRNDPEMLLKLLICFCSFTSIFAHRFFVNYAISA